MFDPNDVIDKYIIMNQKLFLNSSLWFSIQLLISNLVFGFEILIGFGGWWCEHGCVWFPNFNNCCFLMSVSTKLRCQTWRLEPKEAWFRNWPCMWIVSCTASRHRCRTRDLRQSLFLRRRRRQFLLQMYRCCSWPGRSRFRSVRPIKTYSANFW